MRQIKFRAWTGNRMIDFEELKHGGYTPWNSTSLIWMQFTGLFDKNGKEVWEGSIVKCQQGCPHEVIWDSEIGGTYGGGMPGWHLNGLLKNCGKGYAWTGEEEVIGDIYSTPELLS